MCFSSVRPVPGTRLTRHKTPPSDGYRKIQFLSCVSEGGGASEGFKNWFERGAPANRATRQPNKQCTQCQTAVHSFSVDGEAYSLGKSKIKHLEFERRKKRDLDRFLNKQLQRICGQQILLTHQTTIIQP